MIQHRYKWQWKVRSNAQTGLNTCTVRLGAVLTYYLHQGGHGFAGVCLFICNSETL